jgi:hypothetical protein
MQIEHLDFESTRLKTFKDWKAKFPDKHQLALFGFFYCGERDTVICNFCTVEIGNWVEGDDVLMEHHRWSPYCKLLTKKETKNVPIDVERFNKAFGGISFEGSEELNTVSEGTIESLTEDDVHMYHHNLYKRGALDAVYQNYFNNPN